MKLQKAIKRICNTIESYLQVEKELATWRNIYQDQYGNIDAIRQPKADALIQGLDELHDDLEAQLEKYGINSHPTNLLIRYENNKLAAIQTLEAKFTA